MSGWSAVLALAVFVGVWSSSCQGRAHRLRPPGAAPLVRRVWFRRPVIGLAAASTYAGWLLADGRAPVLALVVGVAVLCAVLRRLVRDWVARRQRRDRQRAVIELCDALSAELRAGLPADRALARSGAARPEWAAVVSAARLGGDVVDVLRHAARQPGAEGLRAVAAGWDVAGRSGAGLALVLERIAAGLRSDDEARSEVIAALGPPRATAKMLAVLPVFGLGLGSSMGARPIAFLLHTDVGLACLALGLVLATLGVLWVERLASSAEV